MKKSSESIHVSRKQNVKILHARTPRIVETRNPRITNVSLRSDHAKPHAPPRPIQTNFGIANPIPELAYVREAFVSLNKYGFKKQPTFLSTRDKKR